MRSVLIAVEELDRPLWPEPRLVVSDMHVGDGTRGDQFQAEIFGHVLDLCPPSLFRIIRAGDNEERYESSRKRIRRAHAGLYHRLSLYEVDEVEGNHDLPGRDARLVIDEGPLYVSHGHDLDPACAGRGTLARVGGAVWGALERVRLAWAFGWARNAAVAWNGRRLTTASRRGDDNGRWKAFADRLGRERGKRLVIMGHTHRADLERLPSGVVYLNPGCCTDRGRVTFGILDGISVELWELYEEGEEEL